MSWKDTLNSALYRTTGYLLTRETPEQRHEAVQAATRQAAQQARKRTTERHRRTAAKRAERLAAAEATLQQREEDIAWSRLEVKYDDDVRKIIRWVRKRTMTGPVKLATLILATRYVVRHQVPGAVVECGVWRGGSMQAVAYTLLSAGETDRELHLFDTFEGMPPPTEKDRRVTDDGSVSADDLLADAAPGSKLRAAAGLEDVQKSMAATGYPDDKVHFHPGLVEDTTPGQAPDTIAILRLDTDWYASTKHELEHLYERLSPGGVLILDDYGDWEGSRKATDEWLAKTGEPLFLAPMGSGRIAVKPFPTT
jgi:O-methyltransferase